MKRWSIVLVALLAACSPSGQNAVDPEPSTEVEEENTEQPTENEEEQNQEEQEEEQTTAINLHEFFMPNQSEALFEGYGNEYATYTLTTQHLYENYVGTFEDNGGTVMQRIYRIEDERIVKIYEQAEAYDADFPALSELEALPEMETYLALPFEEGNEFNGWTIVAVGQTVETPFQTFEDVIVLTQEGADQSIVEKYFVKGYGEVKRVFKMSEEENEEFEVTSTLAEVK